MQANADEISSAAKQGIAEGSYTAKKKRQCCAETLAQDGEAALSGVQS